MIPMEEELLKLVKIIGILTVLIWGGFLLVTGVDLWSTESVRAVFTTVLVIGLLTSSYLNWGWKLPIINKIFYRPNLNGTWIGELKSDWVNDRGVGVPTQKFVIVIQQRFFAITIKAYSESLTTTTFVERLSLDKNSGFKQLAYIYSEKRSKPGGHGDRLGAAVLDLTESLEEKILKGDFWTFQKSTGFVRVKLIDQKVSVESFEEAVKRWDNLDLWARV